MAKTYKRVSIAGTYEVKVRVFGITLFKKRGSFHDTFKNVNSAFTVFRSPLFGGVALEIDIVTEGEDEVLHGSVTAFGAEVISTVIGKTNSFVPFKMSWRGGYVSGAIEISQ